MGVGAKVFQSSVWKAELDLFPRQSWKAFWIKWGVVGLADESIIISRLKAVRVLWRVYLETQAHLQSYPYQVLVSGNVCNKYYTSLLTFYPRYYAVFVTKILYKENENNCFQFIRILWKYEYNIKFSWHPPPSTKHLV